MTKKKNLLFLLRQSGNTVHAQEALDSVLVAGVFDQSVAVLFKDDGVWQLTTSEVSPVHSSDKTTERVSSLADYDITALYACEKSLSLRNLTRDDLQVPVTILNNSEQAELLAGQHAVVND